MTCSPAEGERRRHRDDPAHRGRPDRLARDVRRSDDRARLADPETIVA